MRYCFLICLFIYSATGFAQKTVEIDLNRIPQEKVRNLLVAKLSDNSILPYQVLRPTYHKGQCLQGYHRLQSVYLLKNDLETVWKSYQITSPAKSWNGSMISFGLLVSKPKRSILYYDDVNFSGIDTGQVFFVNLKVLMGLYNLAVGLEIVDVDPDRRSITYSYLQGGKSRGKQTIFFVPTKKGYTEIIHQTAFKGDSFIRDRCLYPFFHRMAINELHRNMKKCIRENKEMLAQKQI